MNRPAVVTVFGILDLFVALFGLCGAAVTAPVLTLQKGPGTADALYAPYLDHPVFHAYMKLWLLLSGLLCVVLAVSGVGLLLMKGWGRRAAVIYAAPAIVLGAIGVALVYTIYIPSLLEHTKAMAEGPTRTATEVGAYVVLIGVAVCHLGYPIALLIFMTRAKVHALFAPPPPAGAPPAN